MEITSRILYLDRDYNPVGTANIILENRVPVHNKADNALVMANGAAGYEAKALTGWPRYWVRVSDNFKDLNKVNFRIDNEFEAFIRTRIRFSSAVMGTGKRMAILKMFRNFGMNDANPNLLDPECTNIFGYVIIGLIGRGDFTVSDLLRNCRFNIEDCTNSIKVVKEKLIKEHTHIGFINEQIYTLKHHTGKYIEIGKDHWVDVKDMYDIVVKQAYAKQSEKIHDLKKRLNELERYRSWVQYFMKKIFEYQWTND